MPAKSAFAPLPQVCTACRQTPPPLDACIAAVDYEYPWPELIARFKFRHSTGLAGSLAQLMAAAPWSGPLLDLARLMIPMPLSRERLRQRGFNQSLLLAKHLRSAGPQARLCKHLLVRRLDTQPQSSLSRADRARNVQHAFEVPPEQAVHIQGQQVVLIDDVMTSGATMYAAALALRRAGADHVSALVLARTRPGFA